MIHWALRPLDYCAIETIRNYANHFIDMGGKPIEIASPYHLYTAFRDLLTKPNQIGSGLIMLFLFTS
jgi:hypothetical protein